MLIDPIEKKIAFFVENQFPDFYKEEGPRFIEFVRAYLEWMEQDGNQIEQMRNHLENLDIDTTVDSFVDQFVTQYMHSIPNNVLGNKRFLIKHILDIYRSKGSIQGYKLLFKLLYNEDITVYIPSQDILRASDANWYEPYVMETTDSEHLRSFVGKTISGISTQSEAFVEEYSTLVTGGRVINILYLTNIYGEFVVNEYIVPKDEVDTIPEFSTYPRISGSVVGVQLVSGGQGDFRIGDTLKLSGGSGVYGIVRVGSLRSSVGGLTFDIRDGGEMFTVAAEEIITRTTTNTIPRLGAGASFDIRSISSVKTLTVDTSMLYTDMDELLGTDPNEPFVDPDDLEERMYGTIANLENIRSGRDYALSPSIVVRDFNYSNLRPGTINVRSTNTTVTGTGTFFQKDLKANSFIQIVVGSNTYHRIVKQVISNTQIVLDDYPAVTVGTAQYKIAAPQIAANFTLASNPSRISTKGRVQGEDEAITALAISYNNVIDNISIKNAGFGYMANEVVDLVITGIVRRVDINRGGQGYANTDPVIFSGGFPTNAPSAHIITDDDGRVIEVVIDDEGSGFQTTPDMYVLSDTGNGSSFRVALGDKNPTYITEVKIILGGVSRLAGRFRNTNSFLNSDKYIQDSYYYQTYSYEIQSVQNFNRYKEILKDTFHIAGTEMFGKTVVSSTVSVEMGTKYDFEIINGIIDVQNFDDLEEVWLPDAEPDPMLMLIV